MSNLNILIPMAGSGQRFIDQGYLNPKPLIDVDGIPMIQLAVKTLGLDGHYIFITRKSHKMTDLLTNLVPGCSIIEIDEVTSGATATALVAKDLINNDTPLVVTNCDQALDWDDEDFIRYVSSMEHDGCLVTYKSTDLKNSFAKVENGVVTEVVEKKPLGDEALIGVHHWTKGSTFVEAAEWLVDNFKEMGYAEPYVSLVYQRMIELGAKVVSYRISDEGFMPLGTPQDLTNYLQRTSHEDLTN